MSILRATTWAHARGLAPLAAAGQIFADRHASLTFQTETHPVKVFGEGPLAELAHDYDIIVFDHPLTGAAAEEGLFLPLDEHLPEDSLFERKSASLGQSFSSYEYNAHVWGLPLDAACLMSASRPDLLSEPPRSWEEMIALAQTGVVAQGFSRMTATALYYQLTRNGHDDRTARAMLAEMLALTGGRSRLQEGSIQILERMAAGNPIAFLPACYGYSNYCRPGYAQFPLVYHPSPLAGASSILGGAGIAVSQFSSNKELALEFVEWVTGEECQTHIYGVCGGQPAHARAWESNVCNHLTGDFYRRARPIMEDGWHRSNHPDFHEEQSRLANDLHAFLDAISN